MRALLSQRQSNLLFFYSALYFAASLPFQLLWFPPTLGIIGMMAAWFFTFDFKGSLRRLGQHRLAWLPMGLFFISLLGMLYTGNPREGWQDVGVRISLVLLPLSFIALPKPLRLGQLRMVVKAFAWSAVVSASYLVYRAWLLTVVLDFPLPFHNDFVFYPKISVHYYALYLNLAIFILLQQLLSKRLRNYSLGWWVQLMAIVVLILSVMVCAARLQIMLLVIGSSIFLFHHFRKRISTGRMFVFQAVFVLLIAALVWLVPSSRQRLVEAYREVTALNDEGSIYQTNHRVYIWSHGWEVIMQKPWLGSGTGAANDALHEQLKQEDARFWESNTSFYTLDHKKYNFHNSFLQHWANYGLAGLILLSLVFWKGFTAVVPMRFLSTIFLTFCLLSFMTESMLVRQAGTLFFSFFYSLFIILPLRKDFSSPQKAD